jgi:hypothetical protein
VWENHGKLVMPSRYENGLLVTCTLKRGFYLNLGDYMTRGPFTITKIRNKCDWVTIEANASYLETLD